MRNLNEEQLDFLARIVNIEISILDDDIDYDDFNELFLDIPEGIADEETLSSAHEKADLLFRGGEPEKSMDSFYKIFEIPLEGVEKWIALYKIFSENGDYDYEMKACIELGINEDPENEMLTNLYNEMEQFTLAIAEDFEVLIDELNFIDDQEIDIDECYKPSLYIEKWEELTGNRLYFQTDEIIEEWMDKPEEERAEIKESVFVYSQEMDEDLDEDDELNDYYNSCGLGIYINNESGDLKPLSEFDIDNFLSWYDPDDY